MERTLKILNEMVEQKIIERYVIGGAIAALFYIEPFETYDLDVFVVLPDMSGPILTLDAIYQYLQQRGYTAVDECVLIAGVPVQFLVASSPLVVDAMADAQMQSYGAVQTVVMQPEYLVAIMLELLRPKDRVRIRQFLDQHILDQVRLQQIFHKHGLEKKWQSVVIEVGREND